MATGLMRCLRLDEGLRVAAFKCGPDFLDGLRHSEALYGGDSGTGPGEKEDSSGEGEARYPSVNLDGWLMGREGCVAAFHAACAEQRADVAVVEGCMGLFDGRDGASEAGSDGLRFSVVFCRMPGW